MGIIKDKLARLDGARASLFGLIERSPGALGDVARKVNEGLGRPLAPADELADRRAFATGGVGVSVDAGTSKREAAPVIVYHLDKHRRDLPRLTQVLDASDVPYRLMSLEGDIATTEAVRRDAGGRKLPLVFIAGDCVGGREELNAMDRSGELKRRVWGG